jgi:ParB/RepB/Spo0J family partition protein
MSQPKVFHALISNCTRSPYSQGDVLDEAYVGSLMVTIKNGGCVEPIVLRQVGLQYSIIDGYHRLVAYQRLGYTTVSAYYEQLDDTDALLRSVQTKIGRDNITAIEKAFICYVLYMNTTLTPDQIKSLTQWSDVAKYIKFYHYLDHNILKDLSNKIITQETVLALQKVSKQYQMHVYKLAKQWSTQQLKHRLDASDVEMVLRSYPGIPLEDKHTIPAKYPIQMLKTFNSTFQYTLPAKEALLEQLVENFRTSLSKNGFALNDALPKLQNTTITIA